jgi:LCP family protein required for cell wall assembly
VSVGQARRPHPWVASLFSALIPGAGQVYAGDGERGRRLIAIDLGLVVVMVLAAVFFQSEVLKAWASLTSLSLIMVGNLVLLTYRAWAAYDAYQLVSGTPAPAGSAMGAALIVSLVILVPHVALGYLNVVQYSLISEVFAPSQGPIATEPPVTTLSGATTTPGDSVPDTIRGPVIWDGLDRLNILLLGSDVGAGRRDIRTDTMIVVSIDPASGDAVMVSLPRNFSGIELPPGMGMWDCNCFPQLLNDLYFAATENPGAFPGTGEPGPRAIKAAIGHLLGVEIQYYAMVSLDGFVGIVDALVGVDIFVPNRIVDETYPHEDGVTIEHVVIEEGQQHLDGHLALAYARIRRHADDYARMNRQRCVLGAVLEQSSPLELLANYGAIAEVLKETMETDIPRDRLVDFIDIVPRVSKERVGVLAVNRDYISGTDTGRTYYDQERIRAETQALIADPTSGNGGGLSLETTCD